MLTQFGWKTPKEVFYNTKPSYLSAKVNILTKSITHQTILSRIELITNSKTRGDPKIYWEKTTLHKELWERIIFNCPYLITLETDNIKYATFWETTNCIETHYSIEHLINVSKQFKVKTLHHKTQNIHGELIMGTIPEWMTLATSIKMNKNIWFEISWWSIYLKQIHGSHELLYITNNDVFAKEFFTQLKDAYFDSDD